MATNYKLNIFTGNFDIVGGDGGSPSDNSKVIIGPYDCNSSANIGDFVFFSLTDEDKVEIAADNNSNGPIAGVISDKPTTDTCNIMVQGEITGLTGLAHGKKVFISTTATATTTRPITNFIQEIGLAISSNKMFFKPEIRRIKKP